MRKGDGVVKVRLMSDVKRSLVEIPKFHSTEEAIKFGKQATAQQIEELKRRVEVGKEEFPDMLKRYISTQDKSIKEEIVMRAVEFQLYCEALDWEYGEKLLEKVRGEKGGQGRCQ